MLLRALERFILTLVLSHSNTSAISSISYPSTSLRCMATRCFSGSEAIARCVMLVISDSSADMLISLVVISSFTEKVCRRLLVRSRSIAKLCAMRHI